MLSTALTTALPQIMKDFGITATTGQWLTSIYSLVMGILVLATPFLIKRFPTKWLYVASLGVFTFGLVLSAFTASFTVMMAGRVLQAAGNGVLLSLGQVVLLTIYPKEKRGAVMGMYGLAVGAAPVIAPTIAGLIVDAFGWRMIFYIVLIISTVVLVFALTAFKNVLDNEKQQFDFISLSLCSVGFSGLLIGLGNLGSYSVLSVYVLFPLAVGMASAAGFVFRQLHMKNPFLELRILKTRRYRIAVIASVLLYASLMATSVLLPVYIQNIRGYSATISGLVTMPGALVMAVVSPFTGRNYDKMGIKRLFIIGGALLAVSSLGMVFVGLNAPLAVVAALNIFRNIAVGCMMMPLVTWGMGGLEDSHTAHGTALLTSLRTIAGAFGSAIFMAVVSVVSESSTQMLGMNAAFAGLTAIGAAQLALALYVVRKQI